jgi:hypothetical protein
MINCRELIAASSFMNGSYELCRVLSSIGRGVHRLSYRTLSQPSSLQSMITTDSFSEFINLNQKSLQSWLFMVELLVRASSVRSAISIGMCFHKKRSSSVGAAWLRLGIETNTTVILMPLLRSFGILCVGRCYRDGAPNGAFQEPTGKGENQIQNSFNLRSTDNHTLSEDWRPRRNLFRRNAS